MNRAAAPRRRLRRHHLSVLVTPLVALVLLTSSATSSGAATESEAEEDSTSSAPATAVPLAANDEPSGPTEAGRSNPDDDPSSAIPSDDPTDREPAVYVESDDPPVITREQLDAAVGSYVTDEAVALANQPELEAAGRQWKDKTDFVDQIDYQLRFRQSYDFLSSEPEAVAAALTTGSRRSDSFKEMGLLLTPAEETELTRRAVIGERMADYRVLLDKQGGLVDIWQDQANGGVITAYVTTPVLDGDRGRLELEMAARRGELRLVTVTHSKADLESYKRVLRDELQTLGRGFQISMERTPSSIKLAVLVDDIDALPPTFAAAVPSDAYRVMQGELPVAVNDPSADHGWADLEPGLSILVDDGNRAWCTWGANGHTTNFSYLVTAGHCFDVNRNFAGWVSSSRAAVHTGEYDQNITYKQLTASGGEVFLVSHFKGDEDAARIAVPRASNNCYHGSFEDPAADCASVIHNRASHNSWEVGSDRTCASLGRSNTYRCGLILDEDVAIGYGEFYSERMIMVDIAVESGDSGAGAKWENTLDGLLTMKSKTHPYAFMISAYDVKESLGTSFDFNCAVGLARLEPNQWSACPVVDR